MGEGDEAVIATLVERVDNLGREMGEVKDSLRYLTRTIGGMVFAILLTGLGGLLTFILAHV